MTWSIDIITFVPETYPGILGASILGRGLTRGIWSLNIHNIYDFSVQDSSVPLSSSGRKRGLIDDTPYGGGAGMVMRPDVAARAIDHAMVDGKKRRVIYPSPAGRVFTQEVARELSQEESGLIFLCGRFEGVDERIFDHYTIDEISLGDFVLCGGDVAAMAITESTLRLRDHILGDVKSSQNESFETGLLEYPHYTRPAVWLDQQVPEILLSGHHAKIEAWRLEMAKKRTKERRIDLWNRYCHLRENDK